MLWAIRMCLRPGADWPCGGCGGFRMGRPDFCQKGASLSELGPLELRLPILQFKCIIIHEVFLCYFQQSVFSKTMEFSVSGPQ